MAAKDTASNPAHLSLWLVPAARDRADYQALIAGLAARHQSTSFEPHVTLYSGPFTEIKLAQVLAGPSSRAGPIELKIEGIGHSQTFAKTVFVQLAASPPLMLLAQQLRQALPQPAAYALDPHLSLIYQDLPAAARSQLAQSLRLPRPTIMFDQVQAIAAPSSFTRQADVAYLRCLQSLKLPP
jgi:2'-5' RNA ligase